MTVLWKLRLDSIMTTAEFERYRDVVSRSVLR